MKILDVPNVRSIFQTTLALALVILLQMANTPMTNAQSIDVWFGTKKAGDDGMDIGIYHSSLGIEKGSLAVSYTHLTLPTIYSV